MFQERLDWNGAPQSVRPAPRDGAVPADLCLRPCRAAWLAPRRRTPRRDRDGFASRQILRGARSFKWVRLFGQRRGRVVSPVRDAYAHAFVLFAIAWLHRLNGDPRLIDYADRIIAFIDAHLRDPVHGGLYDSAPITDRSKRQNPLMHLLEAYIALEVAAPGRGYLERAKKLVDIFKTRLFRADPGVLLEYFAEDWSAHPDPLKRGIFEPGHHFEWVWLLRQYENLTGEDLSVWILQLDRIARQSGLAENGLIFDEVGTDMRALKRSHRIWPHTEGRQGGCRKASMRGMAPRPNSQRR